MNPTESLAAMPVAEGLVYLLRKQSAAIDIESDRFLATGDTESLHDLRVAMRRLRALLSGFSSCFNKETSLSKRLRSLQRSTNTARDLEVGLALVEKCQLTLPWLVQQWREQLDEEYRGLREALPRKWQELSRELQTPEHLLLDTLPQSTLGAFTATLEAKESEELLAEMKSLIKKWGERRAHKLRIRGKRVRYLLEPFTGGSHAAADAVVQLRKMQDLLGDLNDIVVLRQAISTSLHDNLLSHSDRPRQACRRLKQRARQLRKNFLRKYGGKQRYQLRQSLRQAGDNLAQA